jgi:D-cysteine desulfhydrase family pyridoxal phosphate-dependent enzyme
LAFGGNKTRKLEFIMADVLHQKANCVITWAGVQSNWCRQLTAAAKKLKIKPVLLLFKKPAFSKEYDGNLLLDLILDAEIKIIEVEKEKKTMELSDVKDFVEEIVKKEKQKGNTPYIAPIGGSLVEGSMSVPLGAIAYLEVFLELYEQTMAEKIKIDSVIIATGSGSTQAGLIIGAKLLSPWTRIVGICVSEDKETMRKYVKNIIEHTLSAINIKEKIEDKEIIVFDDYLKEGYGVLNQEVAQAIAFLAREEGIFLDPVYTGKAMAGMLDLIKNGYFREGENIVFLHTGGTPALFPYREKFISFLKKKLG